MGNPGYIVFLCYGHERVFHECTYALLSLSRIYGGNGPADTEIWIYTDKPGWFTSFRDCTLPLHFRETSMEAIRKWRGEIDFVHRVKIETLLDFSASHTGNMLYADTDMVFTAPVEPLFEHIGNERLCMHIMEGRVSDKGNPVLRKLNDYLEAGKAELNGKRLNTMNMWNAGVLGFNTRQQKLLRDVLEFTDVHYRRFPKHVVEQFAFSVYFQDRTNIKAAAPYMLHYWNLKEAGSVLASFFGHFRNRSWSELVHLSKLIQIGNLMQDKVVFLGNRGIAGILAGKKWQPSIPDWDEAAKQL